MIRKSVIFLIVYLFLFGCQLNKDYVNYADPVLRDIVAHEKLWSGEFKDVESHSRIFRFQDYGLATDWGLHMWHELWIEKDSKVIVFGGHGSTDIDGRWVTQLPNGMEIPIESVISWLRVRHPNDHIVLIVCNAGRHVLPEHIRGVYYTMGDVWTAPDHFIREFYRNHRTKPKHRLAETMIGFGNVGDISEFIFTGSITD